MLEEEKNENVEKERQDKCHLRLFPRRRDKKVNGSGQWWPLPSRPVPFRLDSIRDERERERKERKERKDSAKASAEKNE